MKDTLSNVKSSPKIFKKTQTFSASNLNKQKLHLPSRYAHEKMPQKNQMINILSSIQTNVKSSQIQISKQPLSPKSKNCFYHNYSKKSKHSNSNQNPLKGNHIILQQIPRQQSDIQNFKQIFINPIQQNLQSLQMKSKNQAMKAKEITKEYEKLLEFQNGKGINNGNMNDEGSQMNQKQVKQYYEDAIKLLANNQSNTIINMNISQQDFYQEQIRIQPPDFPNSSTASTLSPGSGYAPSIPLTVNISKQNNLHQLLIRAKAGMNTQDIQKQAHLSFYLGMVYQSQHNHSSALKFYRRYLGFAKGMQDKIGMSLGANRVAINYFYNHDIQKSIVFHNQNLKLSDNQNCFAGFYNLGICHRRIQQYDQALEYFETALQWAIQNGEVESECITYGQIAATYKGMKLYQKSLEYFQVNILLSFIQKSLQFCHKLKKTKLQQKNLMNILLISSQQQLYNIDRIYQITCQAYQCAKLLDDKRLQQIFSVNLGIIKGKFQFQNFVEIQQFDQEVDEICQ